MSTQNNISICALPLTWNKGKYLTLPLISLLKMNQITLVIILYKSLYLITF